MSVVVSKGGDLLTPRAKMVLRLVDPLSSEGIVLYVWFGTYLRDRLDFLFNFRQGRELRDVPLCTQPTLVGL